MGNRLFVGNLPWTANEQDLKSFFGEDVVAEVRIISDRETGKSKGFGFITAVSDEAAAEAIRKFDGAMFSGRPLRVSEATERERRPSTGGGGGGYSGGSYGGGGGGSGGGGYGGRSGGGRSDDRGRGQRRGRDQEDDRW